MKRHKNNILVLSIIVLLCIIDLAYTQSPKHFDYIDSFMAADSTQLRYNTLTYLHGRNHFFLRSGRALMVIQSDKVDVGPAINYWLFDAGTPKQSGKKVHAFNFNPQSGNVFSSTLKVIIKNVPFIAFGEQTKVQWVEENGLPQVEGRLPIRFMIKIN